MMKNRSSISASALALLALTTTGCVAGSVPSVPDRADDTAITDVPAPQCPPAVDSPWWSFGQADPVLDEVALYYLGQTWHQASDAAEVLETIGRVGPEPMSWFDEWSQTADRLGALSMTSADAGHPLTAGAAALRSSTYYRAALHRHPDPFAPEVAEVARQAVDAFEQYLVLTDSPCEPVRIPYDGTDLPGYFCAASVAGPAPTLLFHEGKDGWAEDGKFIVDESMKRGYNVVLFDGPGIGKTIRLQGLPFRHDWEAVITPVVDFALAQPETDPDRIGLIAVSLGGYLAPRAAAFEHRLKVLVANPGVLDWASVYEFELGQIDPGLPALLDADPEAFDQTIYGIMQYSDFLTWGMVDSMWHHGVDSPSALMFEIRKYRLDDLVGDITAHALVFDAEAETRGQAQAFYDALTAPKTMIEFTAEEAAQFHVQPGATAMFSHRMFDWLDDTL